jgi:hypothetical protein
MRERWGMMDPPPLQESKKVVGSYEEGLNSKCKGLYSLCDHVAMQLVVLYFQKLEIYASWRMVQNWTVLIFFVSNI